MFRNVGLVGKAFPTLGAGVWLLTGVDNLMLDEIRLDGEALTTFGAQERPFACMDSLVFNKVGFAGKTFSAVGTTKWFLTGVNYLMLDKV